MHRASVVARTARHLGAEIGFFSVLHTWNQKLQSIEARTSGPACSSANSWIATVALSAVAMRTDTEYGLGKRCSVASEAKLLACDEDKPPLLSGDDADDGFLLNRRVIKKAHFLMRGDTVVKSKTDAGERVIPLNPEAYGATLSLRTRLSLRRT